MAGTRTIGTCMTSTAGTTTATARTAASVKPELTKLEAPTMCYFRMDVYKRSLILWTLTVDIRLKFCTKASQVMLILPSFLAVLVTHPHLGQQSLGPRLHQPQGPRLLLPHPLNPFIHPTITNQLRLVTHTIPFGIWSCLLPKFTGPPTLPRPPTYTH